MSTVFAIVFSLSRNLDHTVRAHRRAEAAAGAARFLRHLHGGMAFVIDLLWIDYKNLLGTSVHAKAAALAVFRRNSPFCHVACSPIAFCHVLRDFAHHTQSYSRNLQLVSSTNYLLL